MGFLWVISIEHAGIQSYMLSLSDHQKKCIFDFFRIVLSETTLNNFPEILAGSYPYYISSKFTSWYQL